MLQKNYTTKKRAFKHLTNEERVQIEILLKSNMPKTQIAKTLEISRSILYRELEPRTVAQKDTNFIVKINSRSSKGVEEGLKKIIAIYGNNFNSIFKSTTSDNGSEFSTLKDVIPDVPVYYAHPYS